MPDLYRVAVWDKVRSPLVREWTLALATRAMRRSEQVAGTTLQWHLIGHGLLLLGPTGTGKSCAAALCAREAAKVGRTLCWAYVPDLCDALTSTPRERSAEIRRQESVDLLVWDDFGVRDLADWEIGYLDQIVEARYRARKPMIVTTNWDPARLREDPRIQRMVDRWRERTTSHVVVLGGASMRVAP